MMILKSGLQKNAFLFSLEKTYSKKFAKILTRMDKYANAEEAYDVHLVFIKFKVDLKPQSSRQVLAEWDN